jgi:hypothetical protein
VNCIFAPLKIKKSKKLNTYNLRLILELVFIFYDILGLDWEILNTLQNQPLRRQI